MIEIGCTVSPSPSSLQTSCFQCSSFGVSYENQKYLCPKRKSFYEQHNLHSITNRLNGERQYLKYAIYIIGFNYKMHYPTFDKSDNELWQNDGKNKS